MAVVPSLARYRAARVGAHGDRPPVPSSLPARNFTWASIGVMIGDVMSPRLLLVVALALLAGVGLGLAVRAVAHAPVSSTAMSPPPAALTTAAALDPADAGTASPAAAPELAAPVVATVDGRLDLPDGTGDGAQDDGGGATLTDTLHASADGGVLLAAADKAKGPRRVPLAPLKSKPADAGVAVVDAGPLHVDAGPPAPAVAPAADAGPAHAADAGPAHTVATAVDAGPAPAPTRGALHIVVRDELGTFLNLTTIEISVDGQKLVSKADANGIKVGKELAVYDGVLYPGSHTVDARFIYKGAGGLFGYMEGYTFRPKASATVESQANAAVTITVIGADRGATYAFEKRPTMKIVTAP
jgi:hypothetical protein